MFDINNPASPELLAHYSLTYYGSADADQNYVTCPDWNMVHIFEYK